MDPTHCNIASSLERWAKKNPDRTAILVPHLGASISFHELNEESSRFASGLLRYGLNRGDRVLLLVPFGIEFISLAFALFKSGTVPVLIDPGLGRKNILKCIEEAAPQAMAAIPAAHALSIVFRRPFRNVRHRITVGSRWFWGGTTANRIRQTGDPEFACADTCSDDPAAVLFTSGSTGPPKGVLYTHGMFSQQLEAIRYGYGIQSGEIDLPTFPLFALFGAGMGMTSVIPEMDFTRPAQVNPEKLLQTIERHKVTGGFGSPALWDTVSRYCLEHHRRLPSIKRILMAGAPVPGSLLERFDRILEAESKIHTPYGATESLPVASIERKEILEDTFKRTQTGGGACVGRAVPGVEIRIIQITDDPIPQWNDALELPRGETGEIIVKGPWVTRRYFNRDDATRLAKIEEGNSFWHRMGDVGYIDEQNRLWFCGRKNQRVRPPGGTLFTIPCEAVFNTHPRVKRSALVGVGAVGKQIPVIVIELEHSKSPPTKPERDTLKKELLELGGRYNHTQEIRDILFHREFPVDIRHNAKIFRERLAHWAADQIPGAAK
ncbi:AMP-dependent synthetase [Candidatus Nitromaritima sp. SCGC AAA799-C22]|nr:AMP-dependent synthetase [Candidatus Nitromaritima sp. SCGC AAA799-C22]